jgi:Ran GTPase-activating protein (RanGAP) involved in mRNA processing and transport
LFSNRVCLLQFLQLGCTSIGNDFETLSEFLRSDGNSLRSLNLSQCGLRDIGAFCETLKDNTHLHEINLSHNLFSNGETFAIADMLRTNKYVRHSNRSAIFLLFEYTSQTHIRSLTRVHLMNRIVGDIGRRSIFDAMTTNRHVREVGFVAGVCYILTVSCLLVLLWHTERRSGIVVFANASSKQSVCVCVCVCKKKQHSKIPRRR